MKILSLNLRPKYRIQIESFIDTISPHLESQVTQPVKQANDLKHAAKGLDYKSIHIKLGQLFNILSNKFWSSKGNAEKKFTLLV